jgi:hypothetical protein
MATIPHFVHRCIVPDGDMAGSKYEQPVNSFDFEYQNKCRICKKPLATIEEIVAHIYGELLP